MRRSRIPPLAKLLLLIGAIAVLYGGAFLGKLYHLHSYQMQALYPMSPEPSLAGFELRGRDGKPLETPFQGHWTLLFAAHEPGDWRTSLALGLRVRNRLADDGELQRALHLVLLDLDARAATPAEGLRFAPPVFEATGDGAALLARLEMPTAPGPFLIAPDGRVLGRFTDAAEPATIAADIRHLRLVHDQDHL